VPSSPDALSFGPSLQQILPPFFSCLSGNPSGSLTVPFYPPFFLSHNTSKRFPESSPPDDPSFFLALSSPPRQEVASGPSSNPGAFFCFCSLYLLERRMLPAGRLPRIPTTLFFSSFNGSLPSNRDAALFPFDSARTTRFSFFPLEQRISFPTFNLLCKVQDVLRSAIFFLFSLGPPVQRDSFEWSPSFCLFTGVSTLTLFHRCLFPWDPRITF